MQILPAILVVAAKAQVFDIPDLGNFDLSAFGLAPDAFNVEPAAETGPADGERYFFTDATTTTVTTTTVTVPTVIAGDTCWKCDKMSYADCGATGKYQMCQHGDFDCCFVEVRETKTELKQLCTGCKSEKACMDNKAENFQGINSSTHQCRPDYRQQRIGQRGPQSSVCRQCFKTCDISATGDKNKCFGSVDSPGTFTTFKLKFATANKASYPWSNQFKGDPIDAMGIPTLGVLDSGLDAAAILAIVPKTAGVADYTEVDGFTVGLLDDLLNVYFDETTDGKKDPSNGDSTRESATEMTFWSLQGASMAWWQSDLKTIQTALETATEAAAAPITVANFKPL